MSKSVYLADVRHITFFPTPHTRTQKHFSLFAAVRSIFTIFFEFCSLVHTIFCLAPFVPTKMSQLFWFCLHVHHVVCARPEFAAMESSSHRTLFCLRLRGKCLISRSIGRFFSVSFVRTLRSGAVLKIHIRARTQPQ